MASTGSTPGQGGPSWLRPLVDYGPLAAFFLVYWLRDLTAATVAIMAATAVALALALIVERRVPIMPLVTAAVLAMPSALAVLFAWRAPGLIRSLY